MKFWIVYLLTFSKIVSLEGINITDIQLLGSPADVPNSGRVQVNDRQQWKDVCHDGDHRDDKDWSFTEAMVACRQLGYPGTALRVKGVYGNGNSNKALDAFHCQGDELNLSKCTSTKGPDEEDKCANNNDAGVVCTIPGYIGCYIDDANRVLPNDTIETDSMTVKMCIDHCSSRTTPMRYAGVQYSRHCFCGMENSHYDRLGRVWDNECDMECGGNSMEICGGTWRMSIYDLLLGNCEDPTPMYGSTKEQDFSFGKWVTFVCDEYYELIGKERLQCVLGDTPNDCKWSDEPPKCNSLLPPTTTTETITSLLATTDVTTNSVTTSIGKTSTVTTTNTRSSPGKTNTAAPGTREPQESVLNIGLIIGTVLGALFVLPLIMLLVLFFVLKSRKRAKEDNKSGSSAHHTPMAFDGPYELTIEGTHNHSSSNGQPASDTTHDNTSKEKYPIYANTNTDTSSADIYHEVPESSTDEAYMAVYADVDSNEHDSSKKAPSKTVSVVYAKAQKEKQNKDNDDLQEEGSLYYARSDSFPNAIAGSQRQDSVEDDGEGWEDNAAYSSFQDNEVSDKQNGEAVDDNDEEGWEENDLYGVDDKSSVKSNNSEEWVDNVIYADSDDKR